MTLHLTRDEAGVTLIELVLTLSIMGIVMVALTSALMLGFRTTRDSSTGLDQSNAEQLVNLYLTRDVQGADSVQNAVTSTCGNQPVALQAISHSDPLAASGDVTVTYRLAGNDLLRRVCGPTPSTQTLARNVTSFTASGATTVTVNVATQASASVPAYSWSLEVRRRRA
jgi:prepilin-type N-terminal cleavage/methylation domain-containing protein